MAELQPNPADTINPQLIIKRLTNNWPWFVLSLIAAIGSAYLLIQRTQPEWKIKSKILVQDHGGGGSTRSGEGFAGFSDLYTFQNSADNEVIILKTRHLADLVAKKLQLNVVVSKKVGLKRRELDDELPFSYRVHMKTDTLEPQRLVVKNVTSSGCEVYSGKSSKVESLGWGLPFESKFFSLILFPVKGKVANGSYEIEVRSVDDAVASLIGKMEIKLSEKPATVIDFTLNYANPSRGTAILNAFMSTYLKENLNSKIKTDDSASSFISDRLAVVGKELANLEGRTQKYRFQNEVVDLATQSGTLIKSSGDQDAKINSQQVQIKVVEELENVLANSVSNSIPASLAIENDPSIVETIRRYNDLIASKQKLSLSYKEDNPVVQNVNSQISQAKNALLASLSLYKKSLNVSQGQLALQQEKTASRIKEVPGKERTFMDYSREQKLKEQVYLYLLQKKEETDIAKTSMVPASRIIDPAKSDRAPFKPAKLLYYFAFTFVGLLLPFLILTLREALSSQIKSNELLKSLTSAKVIGEISHNRRHSMIAFTKDSRSLISENFRALRTNLLLGAEHETGKTILVTSSFPKEGKTFTCLNLGLAFTLINKRVLFLEMDLRKPNLTKGLNLPLEEVGLSSYLRSDSDDYNKLVRPAGFNNAFILSAGAIPPNPSELLASSKTQKLISLLRSEYDYLIMDTAPMGLVSDAIPLSKLADKILYVVRWSYSKQKDLMILNELIAKVNPQLVEIVINDKRMEDVMHFSKRNNSGYYIEEPRTFLGFGS